jgi:putative transposase
MKMCTWLEVSTSGLYEWRDRRASATTQRRGPLAALNEAIFDESDGTYGYRRIHAALARQGEHRGPEVVREITRDLGLIPCQPRPWRPDHHPARRGRRVDTDLVERDFTAVTPGTKLVGDITYWAQLVVMCSLVGGPRSAWWLSLV